MFRCNVDHHLEVLIQKLEKRFHSWLELKDLILAFQFVMDFQRSLSAF